MRQFHSPTTLVLVLLLPVSAFSDELRIATWNIENLGGSGRGFGSGPGQGDLPQRSDDDLELIAEFIDEEIDVDLIASQEIAINYYDGDKAKNRKLDKIIEELGSGWKYYLSPSRYGDIPSGGHGNIFCAFIYDSTKLKLVKAVELDIPNIYVGTKKAFDRQPLLGYFEVVKDGDTTNDFMMVNVHLASGQTNEENHLAAMVVIEQSLNYYMKRNQIKESDRIILGDFNDNPHIDGRIDLMYDYMKVKGYRNLIDEDSLATRMNHGLTSVIDHVLINNSADGHIPTDDAFVYQPTDTSVSALADWRKTYSDHFPVIFELNIENDDDDVDW